MKNIIREWTASKNTNDFNYDEALETLIKDKTIVNQSISNFLHFNYSLTDIEDKLYNIKNVNVDIKGILELLNEYSYYLKMNSILKLDDSNIKKLKKLNEILDNDFIDFLDRNLDLDKTILSSSDYLKIEENSTGVIKAYMENDFKFAINDLCNYLSHSIQKNSIKIKDTDLINDITSKHKTKAYLKPISKTAILKCLYFDFLYYFNDITKDNAISIIKEFFDVTLQETKNEHTLKAETIRYIKNNEDLFDKNISNEMKNKIKGEIKNEIDDIIKLKDYIKDNFMPTLTYTDTL
jgi:hypothetical protein